MASGPICRETRDHWCLQDSCWLSASLHLASCLLIITLATLIGSLTCSSVPLGQYWCHVTYSLPLSPQSKLLRAPWRILSPSRGTLLFSPVSSPFCYPLLTRRLVFLRHLGTSEASFGQGGLLLHLGVKTERLWTLAANPLLLRRDFGTYTDFSLTLNFFWEKSKLL